MENSTWAKDQRDFFIQLPHFTDENIEAQIGYSRAKTVKQLPVVK